MHISHVVDESIEGCYYERLFDSSDNICKKYVIFSSPSTPKDVESSILIDEIIIPELVSRRLKRLKSKMSSKSAMDTADVRRMALISY